ncbi:hypothetical protein C1H46_039480 [Malus baccata]|uniref:Aminotransferase class V domain-containing protein n=1 Tax=Malus baccata TaxID=106549 RepID=A0A540KLA1_MALBA|nr:hypothetical protein C1H46_039480 [Malus baccata]
MGRNTGEIVPHASSQGMTKEEGQRKPPVDDGKPRSLVIEQKAHTMIPAHIVAKAISTLHGDGLELRWSGPITPTEREYVEQYVLAKYPQYAGLVEGEPFDLSRICVIKESPETMCDDKRKSPRESCMQFTGSNLPDLDRTQLEPSRLLDILTKKCSFPGSFISIPEIQARNKVLKHCGLTITTTLFSSPQPTGTPRELVGFEDQGFRKKSKHKLKGLFSYPAYVNGIHHSLHWVSEAHWNSWHVLLDATALVIGKDHLNLLLQRPDLVLCTIDNSHGQTSKITCLLVRKKSFNTTVAPSQVNE